MIAWWCLVGFNLFFPIVLLRVTILVESELGGLFSKTELWLGKSVVVCVNDGWWIGSLD